MKRKGISFWEQHLERLVLGAAVLFFLGFTAWQVLKVPNQKDVPGRGTIGPGQIDELLAKEGASLTDRLSPDARAELDLPDHEPLSVVFEDELVARITPTDRIRVSRAPADIGTEFTAGPAGEVVYLEPTIAGPVKPVFEQYFDALATGVVQAFGDELRQRVPQLPQFEPYDLSWGTVAAVFDPQAVLDEYKRKRSSAEPIPVGWYGDRVEIMDVRVEREELVGGVWTNATVLDPIPGQRSFRTRLMSDDELKARDVEAMRSELAAPGVQIEVIRPSFYETLNAAYSVPDPLAPPVREGMTAEEREVARLLRSLRSDRRERDQLLDQIRDLGGVVAPPPPPPSGAGGRGAPPGGPGDSGRRTPPPAGRAPPGGGGTAMGAGGDDAGGEMERNAKKLKALEGRLERLEKAIDRTERKLADLTGGQAVEDDDQADGRLVILAHDLTIEPLKTYRYRFVVDVYNPFYGKKLSLMDEQRELAESIVLSSEPSEWTAPSLVIPNTRVYVTQAFGPGSDDDADALGLGRCTAEVFRFHHGRWWMYKFTNVTPGDLVGDTREIGRPGEERTEVDFATDWFVLAVRDDLSRSDQDRSRGYGADVVLQSVRDDGRLDLQVPAVIADSGERQRLLDEVEAADAAGDLASAG